MTSRLRTSKATKEEFIVKNGTILMEKLIASSKGKYNPFRIFSIKELETATNNFEAQRFIREEKLFILYKGFLNNRQISILKFTDNYGYNEWYNIIVYASQMRHKNFLKLIGCCWETHVPILVFESIEYGTLGDRIYSPRQPQFEPLLWEHRLKISMELANAIAYLHIGFPRPIVDCHIIPSNILLDEHYVAKVFNFSKAQTIPEGETKINDTRLIGLFGFIAPECSTAGVLNEKCDVYCFGEFLFMLLTGQRLLDSSREENDYMLLHYVKKYYDSNRLLETVDDIIIGDELCPKKEQQIQIYTELAFKCVSLSPVDRPTMIDVAKQLRKLYCSDM